MNGTAGQMSSEICERDLASMTNLTVTNGADGYLAGYNITDSIMLSTTQAQPIVYIQHADIILCACDTSSCCTSSLSWDEARHGQG